MIFYHIITILSIEKTAPFNSFSFSDMSFNIYTISIFWKYNFPMLLSGHFFSWNDDYIRLDSVISWWWDAKSSATPLPFRNIENIQKENKNKSKSSGDAMLHADVTACADQEWKYTRNGGMGEGRCR